VVVAGACGRQAAWEQPQAVGRVAARSSREGKEGASEQTCAVLNCMPCTPSRRSVVVVSRLVRGFASSTGRCARVLGGYGRSRVAVRQACVTR